LNEAVVAAVFVFITIGMVTCSSVGKSVNEPFEADFPLYLFVPFVSDYFQGVA
jgi:hypothetical protein